MEFLKTFNSPIFLNNLNLAFWIEVVDNDLSDVMSELGLIKDLAKGNSSTAWGNIQI